VKINKQQIKALVFLYAFEESVDWALLSPFCDDSNLHVKSVFKAFKISHFQLYFAHVDTTFFFYCAHTTLQKFHSLVLKC